MSASKNKPPAVDMQEHQVRDYLCPGAVTAEAAGSGQGPPGPGPGAAPRMLSRNANGTIAMTSHPTNESELQLYRVLQRANLLSYYDTFICQGGDDVHQLCEAGEEEFLEIMALVNMATKPLHVRRLQKALQEWVNNPAMFQTPLVPGESAVPFGTPALSPSRAQPSPGPMRPSPPVATITSASTSPTPLSNKDAPSPGPSSQGGEDYGQPGSPLSLTPVLVESQINRLAESAELLIRSLPANFEPKFPPNKRKISRELENVMNMAEDDPRRMDEIRKYAAIYGRFDCKRKPEKPLTLHEVSVNEAAAQICKHLPALLTRRDELFPLARQVVRDSGYQYSKGHSRSQCYGISEDGSGPCKRLRYDSAGVLIDNRLYLEEERKKKQERLEGIADQLKTLGGQNEELKARLQVALESQNGAAFSQLQIQLEHVSSQQLQLIGEQGELGKQLRKLDRYFSGKGSAGSRASCSETEKVDTDDTDSQFSLYSNASSPTPSHDPHDSPSQDSSDAALSKSGSGKKLTRQMVQETLMDEGLRVVKEYSSQIKEEPPPVTPRPRGRPPRLDKDREYLSAYVKSPPPPPQPGRLQNGHTDLPNGVVVGSEDSSQNSLSALLALSQKGIKQEAPSPATSIKMD